jgi:hypothetical protein
LVWTDLAPRPGWQQMALDEAAIDIARDEDVALLRLYRWETDTVSFGAHEMATRTWNRQALEAAGIPVVRRPTGGRAVWHDSDDLTYSSVARLPPGTALRDFYRTTHEELAAALDSLGVFTAMAPGLRRTPGLGSGACFDAAVGGEVLVPARCVSIECARPAECRGTGRAARGRGHRNGHRGQVACARCPASPGPIDATRRGRKPRLRNPISGHSVDVAPLKRATLQTFHPGGA